MSFTQVHEGKTFPPNSQFPPHCMFKGCTFQASCKFAEGSIFISCKFVKCCPKAYSNPNSEVKKAILENCYLEYVTVDKDSLLKSCKLKARAVVQGQQDPAGEARGTTESICIQQVVKEDKCLNGQDVSPTDGGAPVVKPVPTCPSEKCNGVRGFADSNDLCVC